MTKIAISQSNYIPWSGYFDLIDNVDTFVFLDEVQYTRRDWRNRNKIVTRQGLKWLTIPTKTKGQYYQKISQTEVSDKEWKSKHLVELRQNYIKSACFKDVYPMIDSWYSSVHTCNLSAINQSLCQNMCNYLDIQTKITCSSNFELFSNPSKRLASICEQAGATIYVSGPSAKDYLNIDEFTDRGISVEWFDYGCRREYQQISSNFHPNVSVLDLILNCGTGAINLYQGLRM